MKFNQNLTKYIFSWDSEFIKPKLRFQNYISYIHRYWIYSFLQRQSSKLNGRLLDLGCGSSPYFEVFKFSNIEYTGMDLFECPQNIHINYVSFDGLNIPSEDCMFDTVVATEVIEHISNLDLLTEIQRVLCVDGTFILTVPFIHHLHEEPHDYWRFTKFGLLELLKKSGFHVSYIETRGGALEVFLCSLYYFISQIPKLGPLRLLVYLLLMPFVYISRSMNFSFNQASSEKITLGYQIVCKKVP